VRDTRQVVGRSSTGRKHDGALGTTTYCFDADGKLTSTSDTRHPTVAYDDRGDTLTLGAETLVFDGANRHVATSRRTPTVRYLRDVTSRAF
jgi:hypothetical protein